MDIDEEHRFVHWVEDPEGRQFRVQGVAWLGISGPAIVAADGRPWVQRILGVVNQVLVRAQRPRTHDGLHLEVSRVDGDRHEVVLDEEHEDREKGRRRAAAVEVEIVSGTFKPPRTLGG